MSKSSPSIGWPRGVASWLLTRLTTRAWRSSGARAAVGAGTLTPGEGNSLAALLEVHRRGVESADLEDRIERLEKESNEKGRR